MKSCRLVRGEIWRLKIEYAFFFFQAEDGIRDLVRSRGLGDVYKRQAISFLWALSPGDYTAVAIKRQLAAATAATKAACSYLAF